MYKDFFGLKEEPFSMTPDPDFIYESRKHMELFSSLHYGVKWRKGFMEITGEVGAGKTTISRLFLDAIKDEAHTALILNPNLSESQLLHSIVEDFGIEIKSTGKKALFDALNKFLLDVKTENSNAVLIIDEAQNLSTKALEQVRLISNLETEKEKLIQIILIGQPELREILQKPNLLQLRQRIAVRYHLMPLDFVETEEYILHRLSVAGVLDERLSFSVKAIKAIYEYSKGVPRVINVLCDKILLVAFVRETDHIEHNIVIEAIREIEGFIPSAFKMSSERVKN